MFQAILLTFLAFWVTLLPVYLWGYGVTILAGNEWNRMRFWMGVLVGSISVSLVYLVSRYSSVDANIMIGFIAGFFLMLYSVIFALTFLGSAFARVFLRKIAVIHTIIIFSFTVAILLISKAIPGGAILSVLGVSLLLASVFEEGAKHLMSIGLTGKDFRFSRQDIILFTFFVVLGFVFVENILYFIRGDIALGQWIFRSFFTLIVHVFAASVCAHYWWKALSYKLFSLKYFLTFFFGFLLASTIHMLYNFSLEKGSIIAVLGFAIAGYTVFTRLLTNTVK